MELTELKDALSKKEATYLETLLSDPTKRLKEHSEIELSVDELAEAIIKAKAAKNVKLIYESNDMLRRERAKEMVNPFTPEELVKYCQRFYFERFNQHFIIDSYNKDLVQKLALYFTNNEIFNVGSYTLNKGICVRGNVGTGKTELMKFFQKNKKRCYRIISCSDIANDFLVYGEELEDVYLTPIEKPLADPSVFYQKHIGNCFDDLGTEELKNNYGNKKNVMADILMEMYKGKDYEKYFITTNLNNDEIEQKYGSRVLSRLREMFNVFILDGKDRRI